MPSNISIQPNKKIYVDSVLTIPLRIKKTIIVGFRHSAEVGQPAWAWKPACLAAGLRLLRLHQDVVEEPQHGVVLHIVGQCTEWCREVGHQSKDVTGKNNIMIFLSAF